MASNDQPSPEEIVIEEKETLPLLDKAQLIHRGNSDKLTIFSER